MGLLDPSSTYDIASAITHLLNSPSIKSLGKQLQHQLPEVSGPFRAGYSQPGASSNIGQLVGQAAGKGIAGALPSLTSNVQNPQSAAAPVDPLMALYQQLVGQLQQPVNMPTGIDTAGLMKQVQAAINPIYDQQAKSAQARTDVARKDVAGMYGALSQDYEKLAPQQLQQAADAQKQIEQLYGQLRSNVEGSYSRVSNEQADLFKSLGIEAALPDVLAKQAAPVQEASLAASENQAQQQQRYMDEGQIDSTYYREGAPRAIATGNEVSTNMLAQLQDYLGQVEANRASGTQTGYLDQLNQAQNQLGQQQQQANTETGRRQDMLWQMLQGQLNAKNTQTALTPDTFMSQLPQGVQQSVASAFTQLQRSPEAVYGKTEDPRSKVPGTYVATTPQWYLAQADKLFQEGKIDATTHQALLMYLQLSQKGQ